MVFVVLAAADLYGQKTNFELQFLNIPTYAEFRTEVEAILAMESSLRRPADVPPEPFVLQRMQVFDDRVALWIDLVSAAQLKEYCQVYIFQKETAFHREVQSKIPPPCKTIPVAGSPHGTFAADPLSLHGVSPTRRFPTTTPSLAPIPGAGLSRYMASPSPVLDHHYPAVSPPLATRSTAITAPPAAVTHEPTHSEKVHYVFTLLDKHRQQTVSRESFISIFTHLNIGLPSDQISELFAKADANRDDIITFNEFQRFGECYPTLLDCLYYRSKDEELDKQQQESIEAARKQLEDARERLRKAQDSTLQAAHDIADQEAKLAAVRETLEDALMAERDAQALLDSAQAETHRVRTEVGQRAQDLAQAREKSRQAELAVADADVEIQLCHATLRNQQDERLKSERRLTDLLELVRQQENELQAHKDAEERAVVATEEAEAKRKRAESNLKIERDNVQHSQEALAVVERELADAQDRQRERGVSHLQAKDIVAKCQIKQREEERQLAACHEKERMRQAYEAEAEKEVVAQQKLVETLLQDNEDLHQKRKQSEDEEGPLLSEEVRLRFQREALEQQEARLRDNHKSFHTSTGRHGPPSASPARGFSRSPSATPFTPGR